MVIESKLAIYGDKDIFEKRLKEGYEEVAFGRGKCVNNEIISALWVFYNTNKIATYEYPKFIKSPEISPCKGPPYEKEYSKQEFEEYLRDKKIFLSKKISLEEIINKWEKYLHYLHLKINHPV